MLTYARLGQMLGIDLYVKRDDLFPTPGGGNKGRKIGYIAEHARSSGADALVTTGGAQSNHAREVALAAAARGWRCRLILHGDPADLQRPQGNLMLMLLAGAEVEIVSPEQISGRMAVAMARFAEEGHSPYEIPGGGHTIEGAQAYVDACAEVVAQCEAQSWLPDVVIHASGTGTTQAGLVVGFRSLGLTTQVIGVSVARRNPRGATIVRNMVEALAHHGRLSCSTELVEFRHDWVGAGYGQADSRVLSAIGFAAETEGLILDPTYTGKAFLALMDLVRLGEIAKGTRVLFWHTGGLLNLMASDAFNGGWSE
jgi:1-aminocyclopropane-1-carboxylate deaminase/D-cysteine desulfhydrase-like pyridoxal-dependent ACC family enzyme